MTLNISLVGDRCSRCKAEGELRPFRLMEHIIHRGKAVKHPWLCGRCALIEKKKAWAIVERFLAIVAPKKEV